MARADLTVSKQELLEREAVEVPRATWLGFAAAALGVGSVALIQFFNADLPAVTVLDALNTAVGQDIGRLGLTSEQLIFFDDHAFPFLTTSVLQGLASLCYAYVLVVVFRATAGRGERVPRLAQLAAAAGGVTAAIGTIGLQIAIQVNSHNAIAEKDWSADPDGGTVALFCQVLLLLSAMGLALGTVLIALAAMRAGLLTKFLGWLGVGVGATMVLSLASTSGAGFNFVQVFWVLLVGLMLSGRAPSGRPPAWDAGEVVPWPSQQELREQRQQSTPQSTPTQNGGSPNPATSKKKRKKRR